MADQAKKDASNNAGFWKEFQSWKTPEVREVAPAPQVGSQAPSSVNLSLPDGRLTLIVFLRHCGCPFAEKTFKALTKSSAKYKQLHCIAVSHSSAEATERWIPQVGGVWGVEMLIDDQRELYSQWGLGISNSWHVLSPRALYATYRLGADEGIWNRPTESGSRWQTSGAFAVDRGGIVRWAHVANAADDLPDLEAGIQALGIDTSAEHEHKKGTHH